MHVTVDVEVDASEVLRKMDDEHLIAEIESRKKATRSESPAALLDRVYNEFRNRGDAPPALREYIYVVMGRIL